MRGKRICRERRLLRDTQEQEQERPRHGLHRDARNGGGCLHAQPCQGRSHRRDEKAHCRGQNQRDNLQQRQRQHLQRGRRAGRRTHLRAGRRRAGRQTRERGGGEHGRNRTAPRHNPHSKRHTRTCGRARRQRACGGAGDNDDGHRRQADCGQVHSRRQGVHGGRHGKRLRNDSPRHGDHARVPDDRRRDIAGNAFRGTQRRRGQHVQYAEH